MISQLTDDDPIFSPAKENTLYLLDLDGTLVKGDSFFLFLKKALPYYHYYFCSLLLIPFRLLAYSFKCKHPKEMIFYSLFRNWHLDHLTAIGEEVAAKLDKDLFPLAKKFILRKRSYKERFIVVSASLDIWVKPFCRHFDLEYICTETIFKNKLALGIFSTPNCKNKEKVNRIKQFLNVDEGIFLVAFGNSPSDIPMLRLAKKAYYRAFG